MTSSPDSWKYQFEVNFDNINPNYNCSAFFKTQDGKPEAEVAGSLTIEVCMFCIFIISMAYIPILFLVWKNREKQAVYFKSPLMILMGGTCLYLDSIMVTLINTDFKWNR